MPVSGGLLYALPKTRLCVAVTVERRDLSSAEFSPFASEYLGVDERFVDTSYRIVAMDVTGENVADADNYFFVKVRKGSVTIDPRHLLLAVGMPNPAENVFLPATVPFQNDADMATGAIHAEYNLYDRADTFYTRYDTPGRPTKISTRKDSRSLKQRAAAAAQRLDEIQSKRRELIEGEYEGSYSREAVQYLDRQLASLEADIIGQFCGEVKRETVRFYVDPTFKRKEDFVDTVTWFSPAEGFSGDEEHLPDDAFPLVCSIHNDDLLRNAYRFVRYHTSGVTHQSSSGRTGTASRKERNRKCFRYRLPETATVTLTTPDASVSRQIPISQLGAVLSLPRHSVKALFDANTLDLIELHVNN